MSLCYFPFLLTYQAVLEKQEKAQQERELLALQLRRAEAEFSSIRQMQEQAHQYRHDLRHHFALLMGFAEYSDDILCLNNALSISIAMDDGSVHAFNAENYYPDAEHDLQWNIDPAQAEEKLPSSLTLEENRKVCIESPGGSELACYELRCIDSDGNPVTIYVDGDSGAQVQIVLD